MWVTDYALGQPIETFVNVKNIAFMQPFSSEYTPFPNGEKKGWEVYFGGRRCLFVTKHDGDRILLELKV